jgi:CubicO group peptidase (beta-lactamase class C family)
VSRSRDVRPHMPALTATAVSALLVWAVAGAGTARSGQEEPGPQAAAGALVTEYLDVLNSGDGETIRSFVTRHCAPPFVEALPLFIHVTVNAGFYYESAGLGYDFHAMREAGPNAAGALVRNRLTGSWMDLSIPLSGPPADKIVGFPELEPVSPPPDAQAPGKLSDDEIVARLETCMAKLIEHDAFSGVVLVARDGAPLFQQAYGLANKSYEVPNRLDTKFNIASVGKVFTGVAVAQLAQEGRLSLDDPVSEHLPPGWLAPEVGARIRIEHLLTHTSGLGDYFRKLSQQASPAVFRGLEDYKVLTADETPAFEPGTRWSYSNAGMLLLGVVIEQVTGQSYFDYVREHVYEPAGMANTDAYEKDRPVPNRATGYMKVDTGAGPEWMNNRYTRVMKGGPSGGSFSTAEDLLKFDVALRGHRLLSPQYTELVLSPKPEVGSPFYGYGFFVSESGAGRVAHHSGDGSGIEATFRMYLDAGYTVIVLSNYNRPAASIVDRVLHQLIACR